MNYPYAQKTNEIEQAKRLEKMQAWKELSKLYHESSTIDEYKVNRDLKGLRCPAIVDVFVLHYILKNYGRDRFLWYIMLASFVFFTIISTFCLIFFKLPFAIVAVSCAMISFIFMTTVMLIVNALEDLAIKNLAVDE